MGELPPRVLQAVVDVLDPSVAALYLRDEATGDYVCAEAYPPQLWDELDLRKRFGRWPPGQGAIGQAVQSRRVNFVDNPAEAMAKGAYVPFYAGCGQEVVIPALAHDEFSLRELVVAVIVVTRDMSRPYEQRSRLFADIIFSALTGIYNRSIAKKRRSQRLAYIQQITDFYEEDGDSVIAAFLQAITRISNSRFASLWLFNDLDDKLVIRSFAPATLDGKHVSFRSFDNPVLSRNNSLSGSILEGKRPRLFAAPKKEPLFANPRFARKHGLRWFVSIPVLDVSEKPLGVVNLWPNSRPEDYDDPSSLETLGTYVRPIARALRWSSLLIEDWLLTTYDKVLDALLEFDHQPQAWDVLARLVKDRMHCEQCSIFLESAQDEITLMGTTGLEKPTDYSSVTYFRGEGLTGTCYSENRPIIYYPGVDSKLDAIHKSKHREATPRRSRSLVFVPIPSRGGQARGVIRCNNKDESPAMHAGRFTAEDLRQLERIAFLVDMTHARAQTFEDRKAEWHRTINSLHHEILSPVQLISLQLQWLEARLLSCEQLPADLRSRVQLKIEDCRINSRLLEMLVTSIGRYEENLVLEERETRMRELVHSCFTLVLSEAKQRGVTISMGALSPPRLLVDELHFMRVVYNLLRNAVKYADPSETTRVVTIRDGSDDAGYEMVVSDNGIGVPKGEEDVIFRKFRRGSNAAMTFPEGSGLGLHYCRLVLEAHDGRIRLTNREKPTEFTLSLPPGRILRRKGI